MFIRVHAKEGIRIINSSIIHSITCVKKNINIFIKTQHCILTNGGFTYESAVTIEHVTVSEANDAFKKLMTELNRDNNRME